ncbi:sulfite exporter TauE/SafE family protein [Achromobacter anxifer]|uniref:sulfite exporter TauE/SafE family protein n=1 Tax=Achromobacter anxifer TaxID=1287737 RepID=UPI0023F68E2A|nr:sulfite exporter TauE/SafE family protein [Achromobacter anxifer]MDF8362407.1 sulfite exporter TauE/SafE family protein [Achromobacter anxifer]
MDSVFLVVTLGAVIAGFVQGLSGFAFGLVAMSFWAWVLDPRLAATLAVFGALVGQIIAAITVRRGFDLQRLLPFVLGGLLGIPLGVMLLPRLDMDWFKATLGVLLVLWCPAMLYAKNLPRISAGGRAADAAVGMAGGVLGGIGGFAGTLPTLWCTLRGFEKNAQRAVIQNFNLSVLLVTMGTYLATGIVTRDMLPLFAIVAAAMLVPALLGAKIYIGISEARFRQIVLGLLTGSGVALLASAVQRLLERMA